MGRWAMLVCEKSGGPLDWPLGSTMHTIALTRLAMAHGHDATYIYARPAARRPHPSVLASPWATCPRRAPHPSVLASPWATCPRRAAHQDWPGFSAPPCPAAPPIKLGQLQRPLPAPASSHSMFGHSGTLWKPVEGSVAQTACQNMFAAVAHRLAKSCFWRAVVAWVLGDCGFY